MEPIATVQELGSAVAAAGGQLEMLSQSRRPIELVMLLLMGPHLVAKVAGKSECLAVECVEKAE